MKSIITYCVVALLSIGVCQAKGNRHSASVSISNGPNNPVPVNVQNADRPSLQAYVLSGGHAFTATEFDGFIEFDIPAGKRLVIQSVTFSANVQPGQNLWAVSMQTTVSGQPIVQDLVITPQGPTTFGGLRFTGTHALPGYCDAGTRVISFEFSRDTASGNWDGGVCILGYLVDLR
jgi:hypothetical protein